MKFPKVEVSYSILFNNTGLDWTDIQDAICHTVEQKYSVLHCIGSEFSEKSDVGAHYVKIKDVPCQLYFRVRDLNIEVIAIKSLPIDNDKWICDNPKDNIKELFLATVNRKSDDHTWVQNMIWDGYTKKWLWSDDPCDEIMDKSRFSILAWQELPPIYNV